MFACSPNKKSLEIATAGIQSTLDQLWQAPGLYDYPKDYTQACMGATQLPQSAANHRLWRLDTTRYTHHPAENYVNGQMVGFTKDLTDHHGVIAVKSVALVGNGELEKWDIGDHAKYGNVYFIVTPGACKTWSPAIEATGSDPFRSLVAQLSQQRIEHSGRLERADMGCAEDISDYKKTTAVVSILPGPYPTHVPTDAAAYPQCEFGLQHQSITYDPPKPIIDINAVPALASAAYCMRVMESDPMWDDTVLLQAPFYIDFDTAKPYTMAIASSSFLQSNIMTMSGGESTQQPLIAVELSYQP